MLSTYKLQSAIQEIKEITSLDVALFTIQQKMVVFTKEADASLEKRLDAFIQSEELQVQEENTSFFKISIEADAEYVLATWGDVENAFVIGQMAACQIRNLLMRTAEEMDRNHFIRNVILGNLLTVDIYSKAKKMHIEAVPRVVFVIDAGNKNTDLIIELVKNMSDLKAGDFVTSVDEHSVILVKDISNISSSEIDDELETIAASLVDNIHMEAMVKVRVGYGNEITEIPYIAQSYQEAKMALQVGRVFYAEKDTISYGKLGIGRLIYQLPMSLCDMFIKEVFGDKIPEILDDEEAMSTISKFFENNLNISETARQLYVHRNTLVYRLERIEKAIGLDIRKFDDAMTFRIAVMVLAHVKEQRQ